ncbi:hypothetical protein SprV_0902730500 [Sparganum proliferum]
MSRDLAAGVISPHRCSMFGHSRLELPSGFSDIVALSATAPYPINDSRRFLPWQRVFRFYYQTRDSCLRSVCHSNPKWCEKAADSFRNVLEIRKRPPIFGVRAVRPFVSFVYAPVDEVARVAIGFEAPSEVLWFRNLVFRLTAVRFDTPIERPYTTAFVADWVVAVEVQYMHRICRFPEHFGLLSTTILAAYEGIQEGQLVVIFLLHRKLNTREDGVEMFLECQHLIPFDDDEGIIHIPGPELRFVAFKDQRLLLLANKAVILTVFSPSSTVHLQCILM